MELRAEDLNLTQRQQDIFRKIIDYYMREPDPIGSRRLAHDFELSSATIRNIMADLEDLGLLAQPHISAGRIPTDSGIRYYIDHLMDRSSEGKISSEKIQKIEKAFEKGDEVEDIMRHASDLLSKLTNYAGIVITPKIINTIYKKIQFIRLSENRILAILITSNGIVQNKVIITDENFTPETLDRLSDILNERFENLSLNQIRSEMMKLLEEEKIKYDNLLDKAIRLGNQTLSGQLHKTEQVFIEGAINIFEQPEFKDLTKLKELFKTLNERQAMIRLLDRCLACDGVVISIGAETEMRDLQNVSIVTSKYSVGENAAGGLGVIGPKRMPYDEVASVVAYMSRLLSYAFSNIDHPFKPNKLND